MAEMSVLNGEVVVCEHAWRWIQASAKALELSESEVIERMLNGYAHSWHQQFEVSTNTTIASLANTIRAHVYGGAR